MKKTILNIIDNQHLEKLFVFLILFELAVCMFDPESNKAFATFVNYFEIFIISIFVIEYFLRLFTLERKRNILKPMMVIDLLTILPVTGLIFFLCITGSSLFSFVLENSAASATFKNLPPSSLWSVVAFVIYCYDGQIPLSVAINFIHNITPSINICAFFVLICVVAFMVVDFIKTQQRAFELRKMTMRQEFP